MAESGGAEGNRGSRRLKTEEEEDRLSSLPDPLIHHILSFLPSTKQAIQTGVLSKRWLNQWRFVSNLLLDFSGMPSDYSPENISRIIDRTLFLHQCSKIQKLHIISGRPYNYREDPNYREKIRFVVRKQAEELILKLSNEIEFRLPGFFFCQPSLVKLKLFGSYIKSTRMLSWESLKDLSIENCDCSDDEVIRSIVSGSPLLQSLEVKYGCRNLNRLVIASNSLKRLVVFGIGCFVDVSCPNLVEFHGCGMGIERKNFGWSDRDLEHFISDSPLLESLELENFTVSNFRITSEFLKKLVFDGLISQELAISCPHLEKLGLSGSVGTIRITNLSSSVCASLDLDCREGLQEIAVKQILESVQHLNELKLGSSTILTLGAQTLDGGISYPLLNSKSLTFKLHRGENMLARIPGILFALHSSPLLEKLVVMLQKQEQHEVQGRGYLLDIDHPGKNYWNSNGSRFSNLVPRLRTVKIIGFSKFQCKPKIVLDLVEFLLRNAIMLEKMVIILEDCGTDFVIKVSQKLLSFPRCSAATVELVCPKE